MSTLYFTGLAQAVAEVTTLTPGGSITTGDVDVISLKDAFGNTLATISFTVGGTTTATAVAAGLIAAWNGNSTAAALATASGTSTVILTAVAAGVPFFVTTSVTGSGTLSGSSGNTTASSGPNDWSVAANWSTGAVPVTGDNVTIDYHAPGSGILYGLAQSAVTLASLTVISNNIGPIGTSSSYLTVGATVFDVNKQPSSGSGVGAAQINVNFGGVATTGTIWASQGSNSAGPPPVNLKFNNSSSTLNCVGGIAGVASLLPGDTSTIGTVYAGPNATISLASGVTVTNVTNGGGKINTACPITTLSAYGGNTLCTGAVEITTENANGGTIINSNRPSSGAAIGTLNLNGGAVDFSGNGASVTVTTLNDAGGKLSVASSSQLTVTEVPTWGTKRTRTSSYA